MNKKLTNELKETITLCVRAIVSSELCEYEEFKFKNRDCVLTELIQNLDSFRDDSHNRIDNKLNELFSHIEDCYDYLMEEDE